MAKYLDLSGLSRLWGKITSKAVMADRVMSLSASEQSQARANIMAGGSNRNLLDNPWWGSGEVVNQRGNTSGTVSNAYFIDRWKLSGAYSIAASGITFTCNAGAGVSQIFNHALTIGGTYTFSVKYADSSIVSVTFAPLANRENVYQFGDGLYLEIDTRSAFPTHRCIVYTPGTSWTREVKAVKLELGSVSTLANDAPPDYAEELAKCQRYFFRLAFNGTTDPLAFGIPYSTTMARVLIHTPVSMANTPTISSSNAGALYLVGNAESGRVVTALSVLGLMANGVVIGVTTSGTLVARQIYAISCNGSGYIDLSAEL